MDNRRSGRRSRVICSDRQTGDRQTAHWQTRMCAAINAKIGDQYITPGVSASAGRRDKGTHCSCLGVFEELVLAGHRDRRRCRILGRKREIGALRDGSTRTRQRWQSATEVVRCIQSSAGRRPKIHVSYHIYTIRRAMIRRGGRTKTVALANAPLDPSCAPAEPCARRARKPPGLCSTYGRASWDIENKWKFLPSACRSIVDSLVPLTGHYGQGFRCQHRILYAYRLISS